METNKAQAEEPPLCETTVLEKPAPLVKDPRKPGLRPAGSSTHCDDTQSKLCMKCCNIRFIIVFPIQIQVLSKFWKGILMTNGCEKMCSRLHRPHHHPRRHQHASPHLTAASRPGWNWPKESRWLGATSPWTKWGECTYVVVQYIQPPQTDRLHFCSV